MLIPPRMSTTPLRTLAPVAARGSPAPRPMADPTLSDSLGSGPPAIARLPLSPQPRESRRLPWEVVGTPGEHGGNGELGTTTGEDPFGRRRGFGAPLRCGAMAPRKTTATVLITPACRTGGRGAGTAGIIYSRTRQCGVLGVLLRRACVRLARRWWRTAHGWTVNLWGRDSACRRQLCPSPVPRPGPPSACHCGAGSPTVSVSGTQSACCLTGRHRSQQEVSISTAETRLQAPRNAKIDNREYPV